MEESKELKSAVKLFCEKYYSTFNLEHVKEQMNARERRTTFSALVKNTLMQEFPESLKIIEEYSEKIQE